LRQPIRGARDVAVDGPRREHDVQRFKDFQLAAERGLARLAGQERKAILPAGSAWMMGASVRSIPTFFQSTGRKSD
jgi:hypothetical protein